MVLKISVPEAVKIFKEIQEKPEKLFDIIRVDTQIADDMCSIFYASSKKKIMILFHDFKCMTKLMEIVAGGNACYTLLAFICLKMEMHWKTSLLGKVRLNLPY